MAQGTGPYRLAMWSGPRNISTAMMRAWEARGDTAVVDEPFYAHYLAETGLDHPGAREIIAAGETDATRVISTLVGPVPGGNSIFYQKHMTHHMLPGIERGWFDDVAHCFLIRDPAAVVRSYVRKRTDISLEDIGIVQQAEIFDDVCRRTGGVPPVIDGRDVLADPGRVLRLLCERLGLSFTDRMLAWSPGIRTTDGVWARHWYDSVSKSSGFERPQESEPSAEVDVDADLRAYAPILRESALHYARMGRYALR